MKNPAFEGVSLDHHENKEVKTLSLLNCMVCFCCKKECFLQLLSSTNFGCFTGKLHRIRIINVVLVEGQYNFTNSGNKAFKT